MLFFFSFSFGLLLHLIFDASIERVTGFQKRKTFIRCVQIEIFELKINLLDFVVYCANQLQSQQTEK